ncbi:MAG TPA: hypothetical protein VF572_02950 [Candidatus Saccharimonadales bacterium]|jgi:F0F1-type ATP synthase epsilon subunit
MVDEPKTTDSSGAVPEGDATKSKDKKGSDKMRVRISSPFKIFFDDEALSLSGENATGPFDILPRHHNFISLLNECELAVRTKAGTTRVKISGGIMHVKADQVVIFLNV